MTILPTTVINTAIASYSYVVDPTTTPVNMTDLSSTAYTQVDLLSITLTKSSDKTSISIGDTLSYSFIVSNGSSFPLSNVFFIDTIPNGMSYVPQTFTINGVQQVGANPVSGVLLGTLPSNTQTQLAFIAILNTLPCPATLLNQASITYYYQQAPAQPLQQGTTLSNTLQTTLKIRTFKQFTIQDTLTLDCGDTCIESILSDDIRVVITRTQLITTPQATSYEGQILTGKKLLIYGYVCSTYEYIACLPDHPIRSCSTQLPFCTFIVVPTTTTTEICSDLIIPVIEDTYYHLLSCNTIYQVVTLRLDALI